MRCVGPLHTAAPPPPTLAPRWQEVEELEEETAHLALELASSFVPYAEEAEEEQKNWKLDRIPPGLTKVRHLLPPLPAPVHPRVLPAGARGIRLVSNLPSESGARRHVLRRHYGRRG